MARFRGAATKSAVSTGTSAKTIVQLIAAANHRVAIEEVTVSFAGVVATDPPVLVEVVRQTSAGTMSALTPVKKDDSIADTLLTTASHTSTGEPTTTDVLKSQYVHPQSGYCWQARPGDEIIIGGGDRIGVRCTTGTTQSVTVAIDFEE